MVGKNLLKKEIIMEVNKKSNLTDYQIIKESLQKKKDLLDQIDQLNNTISKLKCPDCGLPFETLEFIYECDSCHRHICVNCHKILFHNPDIDYMTYSTFCNGCLPKKLRFKKE